MKNFLSLLLCLFALGVTSCGGGASSSNKTTTTTSSVLATSTGVTSTSTSSSSSSIVTFSSTSSSSSSSSVALSVKLTGTVTFDYVPHNTNRIGLNYGAIEKRPIRGAVIEAVAESGAIQQVATLSAEGKYSFTVPLNSQIKLRIKAQLLQDTVSPKYNFSVTNNTNSNALYVLESTYASSGSTDTVRNLNAASGWGTTSYTGTRAAAPFAILDYVYTSLTKLLNSGNTRDLSPLELRWSTKNKDAEGDYTLGEIGTSFYDGEAIYLLGDADNDTDEYDGHVLTHEWGHYLEDNLFRSDSIGGDHQDGEYLDMRVAMSEGWANAFSGMMLDDQNYMDASGVSQASGFTFNIGKKTRIVKGFFSEGSVGSIFMNFYLSSTNKLANDWTPILTTMNRSSYYNGDGLVSIFLFYDQLKLLNANQGQTFFSLMQEQNINGTDVYAANETNNGGLSNVLPLYKTISIGGAAVNVCSSPENGKYNKLGNSQFIKLVIPKLASYQFTVTKTSGATGLGKPELYVFRTKFYYAHFENVLAEGLSGSAALSAGTYIVELFDQSNRDDTNTENNTFCYDLKVQ